MRVALDTNRYVDLCKGVEETVEVVATATSITWRRSCASE